MTIEIVGISIRRWGTRGWCWYINQ